jgi:segregation and condensation protein B
MESQQLRNIVESALLAAGRPISIDQIKNLFGDNDGPDKKEIRAVIAGLQEEYATRGIELREVASGFRIQVRQSMGQWLGKLWEERPPRYTRALMETLAIIAYRQPVTRGDIEEIRGVAVSTNIIRTLLERDWIKVVGHRDVPGKPAMFGSTRFFLDYFGLKKLDDLPPLAELALLEPVNVQLELGTADQVQAEADAPAGDAVVDVAAAPADGTIADADVGAEAAEQAASDQSLDPNLAEAPTGEDYDDDDVDVSDEELAAAMAVVDAVAKAVAEEEPAAESETDNVASLDDARDAASREPETDFNAERAEVVPIKQP